MFVRSMLGMFLALLSVFRIGVETTKLEHELTPTVQKENLAVVGRNTAEYPDYHGLSRLVSMLEMRLYNAERQLVKLKDVKETASTLANKLKDVSERLNYADKRIAELVELVKKNIADDQIIPKQLYDEETNYQVNKSHGESSFHFLSDGLNFSQKAQQYERFEDKTGNLHRIRRYTGSCQVAFTVALRNHITSINPGQIVPFDAVLYNEGNRYNNNSHMFTCPVPGTYLFTLSVTPSEGIGVSDLSLIVNGNTKTHVASSPGNQGSSTIVTRCEAGENVWASVYYGTFLHGDFFTSFSGFLLWTDALGSK